MPARSSKSWSSTMTGRSSAEPPRRVRRLIVKDGCVRHVREQRLHHRGPTDAILPDDDQTQRRHQHLSRLETARTDRASRLGPCPTTASALTVFATNSGLFAG